jgi:DNA repair exonuclease SbcCD ATPase subunit
MFTNLVCKIKTLKMNLNKLKPFAIIFIATLFFACNTDELENKIADLEQQNHELEGGSSMKDGEIEEYMKSMNEIYDNLATIKEKEKLINTNIDLTSGEINENMKDKIVEDINLINSLLEDNKTQMANLNSKLKKSNLKVVELEKMIQNLMQQLEDKDTEIGTLQSQLASANTQLKVLFEEYNNRIEELGEQTDKLNTAYYCYGTSKELKERGVVTKEGGFIGLGKTTKLSEDFNKEYFTKIDVTLIQQVDIMSKKAKVITNHPADSYKLEGTENMVEKLVILDATKFWSASKYLVIVVE